MFGEVPPFAFEKQGRFVAEERFGATFEISLPLDAAPVAAVA